MSEVKPFTWSYSALKNYDSCPLRHKMIDLDKKFKDEESPALAAGWELHRAFEDRLKGKPLELGYTHYEPMLAKILSKPGKTYGEKKLAITNTFQPCGYFDPNVWFRTVVDCTKVSPDNTEVSIFDWKTGKVAEDLTQLQLMSVTIFAHMPSVTYIKAGLVFVSFGKVEHAEFARESIPEIWSEIIPRVKELQRARDTQVYPPKPSGLCKRYCPVTSCQYHGKGTS
jgi:hypothetical protein